MITECHLANIKQVALENAIDSLSRYKFMMFGYWAAIWVHVNRIDTNKETNPFREFVQLARRHRQKEGQCQLSEST